MSRGRANSFVPGLGTSVLRRKTLHFRSRAIKPGERGAISLPLIPAIQHVARVAVLCQFVVFIGGLVAVYAD